MTRDHQLNPIAYGIHWFRRDLRVAGNPALQWSWKEHSGRVAGLFCFDSKFLARNDFSHNRFGFFLETLSILKAELKSLGSDLLVLDRGPHEAFSLVFETLRSQGQALPATVSFNRDYEPFARDRDNSMTEYLSKDVGVAVHTERDHLLIEPDELLKDGPNSFYQIFTPFSKKWFELFQTPTVQARIQSQQSGLKYLEKSATGLTLEPYFSLNWQEVFGGKLNLEDHCERYLRENGQKLTIKLPKAGSATALSILAEFKRNGLGAYRERRDIPAESGTSRLSIFFKNGSITTTQVIAYLGSDYVNIKQEDGPTTYLKELIWREFYYHILFHVPEVERQAFLPKFRNIAWENREEYFLAWKSGQTGFPIVDAGMRQLNATGWMHNRVRMIVASFLTKDLLIDWRWGEKYFMEKLLDGDLAPNNGGWQWAASTGCDPQPYFRIFNPKLQSEKFDPQAEYIRRWIPELEQLSPKEIHALHEGKVPSAKSDYPQAIVNHQEQKELALELYDVDQPQ